MREVNRCSKGNPERGYAKWMVLNFIWTKGSPHFRGKTNARVFCYCCEKQNNEVVYPLNQAITEVFQKAVRYYRSNCGAGNSRLDPSQFFKNRKGHHTAFAKFWDEAPELRRRKVDKLLGEDARCDCFV